LQNEALIIRFLRGELFVIRRYYFGVMVTVRGTFVCELLCFCYCKFSELFIHAAISTDIYRSNALKKENTLDENNIDNSL